MHSYLVYLSICVFFFFSFSSAFSFSVMAWFSIYVCVVFIYFTFKSTMYLFDTVQISFLGFCLGLGFDGLARFLHLCISFQRFTVRSSEH